MHLAIFSANSCNDFIIKYVLNKKYLKISRKKQFREFFLLIYECLKDLCASGIFVIGYSTTYDNDE